MLEIYDKNLKKLAILENAFGMTETERINAVNYFDFSLPDTDPKNDYCKRFHIIKYNGGESYRIIGEKAEEEETGYRTYECEHMITTLLNDIIPGFVTIGNLGVYTRDVIEYIMKWQSEKHWVLKECDFAHQYEYGWDREKLLAALFSVANRFADKYIWIFDTKVYPYQLSLKRFDENRIPDHYARKGHNRLRLSKQSDGRNICTRLYPYGAGEGVNQLNIAELNGGLEYLQSPPEIIEKYGLIQTPWIDRRYTDAQSLLEAGQVMLNELQEPYEEYEVEMLENPKVGEIVQIVGGIKSYIVETVTSYGEVPQISVKIANRPKDTAGSIADLADRLRIEMTYSQGATQIYAANAADNADGSTPLNIPLYISGEMININFIKCKIHLSRFRAYTVSSITAGGNVGTTSDGATATSQSGGGSTSSDGSFSGNTGSGGGGNTSQSGSSSGTTGSTNLTTEDGGTDSVATTGTSNLETGIASAGPSTGTTNATGSHSHTLGNDSNHKHSIASHSHGVGIRAHKHTVSGHSHTVPATQHSHTTDSHAHSVSVSAHTHSVSTHTHTIGNHNHTVNTTHTHSLPPQINFSGNPASFRLYVNGEEKEFFNSRDADIELTQYLIKDGKLPRDVWHEIGILPNDAARVEISYTVMGFCQSRGDITV